MPKVRFLVLDVHAQTISAAIAEPNGEVRSRGTIRNTPGEIRKLVKRLQPVSSLRACYEAGPTGYVLYWRDALKLARCDRAGDLWIKGQAAFEQPALQATFLD